MFSNVATKVFGSRNQRMLKRMGRSVGEINALEQAMSALGDDQLAAKTEEFRQRAVAGETPEALMAEVFAVVRETAKRVLDMRHFDVQLVAGMVLYLSLIHI